MGVPRFFKTILRRWPRILTYVVENTEVLLDGQIQPVDTTKPNDNGIEFDNLYLDMNNMFVVDPLT